MKAQIFKGEEIPDDMLSMTRPQYLANFKNPCWFEKSAPGDKGANTTLDGVHVRLRCLPYFHLIGVDKSGTTDLWSRLAQHPDVARPQTIAGKETHWWSWRRFGFDLWTRSKPKLHFDWYLQTFDLPAVKILNTMKSLNNTQYHHVITGEGSPTYFWDFSGWELIPQNTGATAETALVTPHCLRHLTPDVKLLLMLRHPVERLYSEYLFLDRFKSEHNVSAKLFHLQVQQSVAMLELCARSQSTYHLPAKQNSPHDYPDKGIRLMVSMYSVWLEQWLKVFPRHQMLIIRNEDYSKNISHHLQTIMDFLGLASLPPSDLDKISAQDRAFVRNSQDKAVGDMLPETRKLLTNFYRKYNEQLATMLSDKRFLWQEGGQ
ncbi:carbohydrate sulfotransferase 15-like [Pomacea canaliculata]|uniref:carbohydrate sulfotransferase 15-like n=1 Tax=Pomacea canaliculata TaxID=400727 RepID=UPI000D72E78C|nr:carbohydrate sulfotransferase 15-like [Pomacea canaliculata]